MVDLNGHVGLVTGGSRGIGRAVARALLDRGAAVVITGRNPAHLAAAAGELKGRGEVRAIRGDVRRPEDCRTAVATAAESFGRLDILVNNAGVGVFGPVADISIAEWQAVIETNLNGVFYCCREAIPVMRRGGGGWIINIGSLAGKNPFAEGAAYNASKFGLVGFTEALMQEVRHDGIRVSGIMPGSVATEFRGARPGSEQDWKLRPEDIARAVLDLLAYPSHALPSRIEMRPSRPPRR